MNETPKLLKDEIPSKTPKLLYPSLIVAAVCVTIFSLLGIASITGHLPDAAARTDSTHQVVAQQAESSSDKAKVVCVECGVIDSVRAVETKSSGSGLGAVLGGVTGAVLGNTLGRGNGRTAMTVVGGGAGAYAGNEIEKNTNRHVLWKTRVRMDNGTVRTFTTQTQPEFAVGSKVKVVDGQLISHA